MSLERKLKLRHLNFSKSYFSLQTLSKTKYLDLSTLKNYLNCLFTPSRGGFQDTGSFFLDKEAPINT